MKKTLAIAGSALDLLAGVAGVLVLIWLAVCWLSADARGATREGPCERLAAEHELAAGGLATCHQVAAEARHQGVDPALAAALAYRESRCSAGARSSSGRHLGPLQVAPRVWCPRGRAKGCDVELGEDTAMSIMRKNNFSTSAMSGFGI